MNVELLRKIAAVIQEKPDEFDMKDFNASLHDCGTTHCIGGWAAVLSGVTNTDAARKNLGLDKDQWDRLCYVDADNEYGGCWPTKFWGEDDPWKPTPQQAAARIEHFIATEGRQ